MAEMKAIPAARKAEKRQVKLKLCIQGPSGSCKTKGALYLASQMWPEAKILLIDTENESASLYADSFRFDTIPLDPPFESSRYEACLAYAEANKYDVVILDTITHQWDGEGGILRRKEELDRRPGSSSFTNWATFTPEHTHFIEAIKQAPLHIIATMRSKQEYALQSNDKGKLQPIKLGVAPIQRDGMDYEFTIVFDGQMDHKCTVNKDRTGLFDGKIVDLKDPQVAWQLRTWLEHGKPVQAAAPPNGQQVAVAILAPPPITKENAYMQLPPKQITVEVPAYIKQAAATVNDWKLEGEVLQCYVYSTDLLKDKNGGEYIAVRQNAKVNGQTKIFCRHQSLFTALGNAKNQHCTFYLGLGKYISIEDVMQVGEQKYKNGQPFLDTVTLEQQEQPDIPF